MARLDADPESSVRERDKVSGFAMKVAKLLLVVPVLLFGVNASAEDEVSGTVKIESTSIGVGVGVEWGGGVLTLNDGSTHDFKLEGLSVGDLGMTKVEASGDVYNLKALKDFEGEYSSGEAAAAAAVGAGLTRLQNAATGVYINLKSASEGVELILAPGGAKITLE